eukprot:403346666
MTQALIQPSLLQYQHAKVQVQTILAKNLQNIVQNSNNNAKKLLLESPSDILYSKARNLFVIGNLGNNQILLIDSRDYTLKGAFGVPYSANSLQNEGQQNLKQSFTTIDGMHNQCVFNQPHGLAFSKDECYIFVADTDHNCVRIIDIDNLICSTIAGDHLQKGKIQVGCQLSQTLLDEPRGLALDQKGNIFVTTQSAVVYLDLENCTSHLIAGNQKIFGFKDGNSITHALFDHPDGIVFLPQDIYHKLEINFDPQNPYTNPKLDKRLSQTSSQNSNNTGIQLTGALIVADTYNHRIRLIDLETLQVTSTLCGSGIIGDPGHQDGALVKTKLNFPQKVIFSQSNENCLLFITELNDCIRVVDLNSKQMFTLCGGFESKNGLRDGDSKTALLNFPYGIVEIEKGNKYALTESDNHSLRIIKLEVKANQQQQSAQQLLSQSSDNLQTSLQNNQKYSPRSTKFNQATYDMLNSVQNSSGKAISETVLDLVQSYLSTNTQSDFMIKEILLQISQCLSLILNLEEQPNEYEDFLMIIKNQEFLLQFIPEVDPISIQPDSIQHLHDFVSQLTLRSEIKLPGIRSLFQWVQDFEKAAYYYHTKNTLNQSQISSISYINQIDPNQATQDKPIEQIFTESSNSNNGLTSLRIQPTENQRYMNNTKVMSSGNTINNPREKENQSNQDLKYFQNDYILEDSKEDIISEINDSNYKLAKYTYDSNKQLNQNAKNDYAYDTFNKHELQVEKQIIQNLGQISSSAHKYDLQNQSPHLTDFFQPMKTPTSMMSSNMSSQQNSQKSSFKNPTSPVPSQKEKQKGQLQVQNNSNQKNIISPKQQTNPQQDKQMILIGKLQTTKSVTSNQNNHNQNNTLRSNQQQINKVKDLTDSERQHVKSSPLSKNENLKQIQPAKQNQVQSISNQNSVPKEQYDMILQENIAIKQENSLLKAKMENMRKEFEQMSKIMEAILSGDKTNFLQISSDIQIDSYVKSQMKLTANKT